MLSAILAVLQHVGMRKVLWPVRPGRAGGPSAYSGVWPVGCWCCQHSVACQTSCGPSRRRKYSRLPCGSGQLLCLRAPRAVGEERIVWSYTTGCATRHVCALGLHPGSIRAIS
eukprot:6273000-Pyramimonas_sp.AAC.1